MNVDVFIEGVGTVSIPALGALLDWCPSQKGNTGPCNFCKLLPPKPWVLPGIVGGGAWPLTSIGYQLFYYELGPGTTNPSFPILSTDAILLGWGAQWFTPTGASAFGWAWPPNGPGTLPSGAGVTVRFDFGGGAGGAPADANGNELTFSSIANAQQTVGEVFSQYYFGY